MWVTTLLNRRVFRVGSTLIGILGITIIAFSFKLSNNAALNISYFAYFTALRTIVPLLIALIILPSLFGFVSPIKSILEGWVCNLVSKLSLTKFGIHYSIALYIIYHRQFDLELSNFTVIFLACCTIIPSFVLAIVLTSIV